MNFIHIRRYAIASLSIGLRSSAALSTMTTSLTTAYSYEPPVWAKTALTNPPGSRLKLANLPTPLYEISTLKSQFGERLRAVDCKLLIKRDDATGGVELGGNKLRKLEFLLADALAKKATDIITIGGEQSNHCRATATAATMLGLEATLILRTKKSSDIGLVGNLLIDRMVGSSIYTCTPGEYGRIGSKQLLSRLARHLTSSGRSPYQIPVGGSNGLGSWGYIEAVDELMGQLSGEKIDHVVFACGSGGTAAGIAIGMALYHQHHTRKPPRVHAMGVCDDPDYFYSFVAGIVEEMGLVTADGTIEDFVRSSMTVHQCKGLGYAMSTTEELEFVSEFARDSGVVLDPVYSGKALYNFDRLLDSDQEEFRGSCVLFWHTGGTLGLFDKVKDLNLLSQSICTKLDVYGKADGLDISSPVED